MARARIKQTLPSATRSGRGGSPGLKPPPFRPVQLATLVDTVPSGNSWLHEMKYDGYRALVAIGGGEAKAYTRSGLDWSTRFTAIVAEAAALDVRSALVDGEALVLDSEGRSSFQALQGALKASPDMIDFYAFDLLELDGEDLTTLPLTVRKEKLRAILPAKGRRLHYSDHIVGEGEKLLASFCSARPGGCDLETGRWPLHRITVGRMAQNQMH